MWLWGQISNRSYMAAEGWYTCTDRNITTTKEKVVLTRLLKTFYMLS